MSHVKVGNKQRHMAIPNGWYVLQADVAVVAEDMVANHYYLKWEPVDDSDVGLPAMDVGDHVIRMGHNG